MTELMDFIVLQAKMYYFYYDEIMDVSVLQTHAYTCVTVATICK